MNLTDVVGGSTGPLRIAIVAAHPEDEIVSAGALLRRLSRQNAHIILIHATDGTPRNGIDAQADGFNSLDAYRGIRAGELELALEAAQIRPARQVALGIPGQEAAFALVSMSRVLADEFVQDDPDIVLCHPFEGGHPDHDATAFSVHAAMALMQGRCTPALVEFSSYHRCADGVRTGGFLGEERAPIKLLLSAEESAVKRRALSCLSSQSSMTDMFLPPDDEAFRLAPRYAFGWRPHRGRLFYEQFDSGMSGSRWEVLAADAMRQLFSGTSSRRRF